MAGGYRRASRCRPPRRVRLAPQISFGPLIVEAVRQAGSLPIEADDQCAVASRPRRYNDFGMLGSLHLWHRASEVFVPQGIWGSYIMPPATAAIMNTTPQRVLRGRRSSRGSLALVPKRAPLGCDSVVERPLRRARRGKLDANTLGGRVREVVHGEQCRSSGRHCEGSMVSPASSTRVRRRSAQGKAWGRGVRAARLTRRMHHTQCAPPKVRPSNPPQSRAHALMPHGHLCIHRWRRLRTAALE